MDFGVWEFVMRMIPRVCPDMSHSTIDWFAILPP
jgi:hypothetical protein